MSPVLKLTLPLRLTSVRAQVCSFGVPLACPVAWASSGVQSYPVASKTASVDQRRFDQAALFL